MGTKFKTLPDLETLVDFVVSKYKPEKIILFGSYATKTERKSSDIDLLIIKETNKRFTIASKITFSIFSLFIEHSCIFSLSYSQHPEPSLTQNQNYHIPNAPLRVSPELYTTQNSYPLL